MNVEDNVEPRTRTRSMSQDSTSGKPSPTSRIGGNDTSNSVDLMTNKLQSTTLSGPEKSPSSVLISQSSLPEPISREVSSELRDSCSEDNSVNSAQKSVRSDGTSNSRRSKGKVADSSADWDPFFEADD